RPQLIAGRFEGSIGAPAVNRPDPRRPVIGNAEVGVGHPERPEDVFAKVLVERLAADLLDHLARPVDAGAIDPLRARLEQERPYRVSLTRLRLEIAHRRAGETIAEP